jgi:toxin ParE1/3/4
VTAAWTRLAIADLRAAYEHIAADSPKAAEAVVNRIFSAVEFLERHPEIGRVGRVTGTRELVISGTPFIVAYRKGRTHSEVLAVLHGARKWPEEF